MKERKERLQELEQAIADKASVLQQLEDRERQVIRGK
jgi:hypothetical protein